MRQRGLATHRFLFRSALAAGNVFAWVVVFRLLYITTDVLAHNFEWALAGTAALYALSHALTFFLTPLAGMSLRRGIRTALIFGTVLAALSFAVIAILFLADPSRDEVFWAVAAFALVQGFYRAFYFIPYKILEEGKLIPSIFRDAAIALFPALAGYVLTALENGAFVLFASCAALALLSTIAVARETESYEAFDWTYGETFRHFFARRNNLAVGLFILDGIQGAALLVIWPLAAFLILGQSFVNLGAVLTATLCVAFLGRYLVRRGLRALRLHKSPSVIAVAVFAAWIARLAAGTPVQILTIDVLYNSGSAPRRFSIDSYAGEQAADGGHYIDEYTAIKEMGLCVGRIAVTILFIFLLVTTAESLAFAAAIFTAAVAAAWSVFLAHRLEKVL